MNYFLFIRVYVNMNGRCMFIYGACNIVYGGSLTTTVMSFGVSFYMSMILLFFLRIIFYFVASY